MGRLIIWKQTGHSSIPKCDSTTSVQFSLFALSSMVSFLSIGSICSLPELVSLFVFSEVSFFSFGSLVLFFITTIFIVRTKTMPFVLRSGIVFKADYDSSDYFLINVSGHTLLAFLHTCFVFPGRASVINQPVKKSS